MIIARLCDRCQVEYQAEEKYLKRGQGRYCSLGCATKHRHEMTPAPTPNAECAFCHVKFYKKRSQRNRSKSGLFFCSREHQIEGYRAGIVVPGPSKTKERVSALTRQEIKQQKINAWLAGDNSVTLTAGLNTDTKSFVKEYLVATRGDLCESCGFYGTNPHSGNSIIQMDHIDGDCYNNNPTNLRLLCPNCHAMTSTYGSLNLGSGKRTHRRR